MRVDGTKLQAGDILGVSAPLHPWGIFVRILTHGNASHLAQVFGRLDTGLSLAEMKATKRQKRYYDPQANKLLTPAEWERLLSVAAMESCTQLDIRSGLVLCSIRKYQPTLNPFRSRVVWVRRHPLYSDAGRREMLSTRMVRLYTNGVKYDYGEMFSFLGMGCGKKSEDICSELPLRNLVADGGKVPTHLLAKCSPADYERWLDWFDISKEVKG